MSLDDTLTFESDISPSVLLAKVAEITGLPEVRNNLLRDESSGFTAGALFIQNISN